MPDHHHLHGLRADLPTLTGPNIDLSVGDASFTVGGRTGHAFMVNGLLPAPLLRMREGQNVRLSVTNNLDEDTSIHWHGLLLPHTHIASDLGRDHRDRCLRELALFGIAPEDRQ